MQSSIERYLKEKTLHSWPSYSRGSFQEFHKSKEIHRRITPAASSNSFSKDNEKSQPQPQKKGRSSIIDSDDENRTLMHERDCFRSHFRKLHFCLFCLNEFSSHDIICILNKMSKRFRFRSLGLEQSKI